MTLMIETLIARDLIDDGAHDLLAHQCAAHLIGHTFKVAIVLAVENTAQNAC